MMLDLWQPRCGLDGVPQLLSLENDRLPLVPEREAIV
jgi:hypothetical protein